MPLFSLVGKSDRSRTDEKLNHGMTQIYLSYANQDLGLGVSQPERPTTSQPP
jgi:hypothetical protein